MLQFERGLGFPTILNFAIISFLKKVKVSKCPWPIQQAETWYSGNGFNVSHLCKLDLILVLPVNFSSQYNV